MSDIDLDHELYMLRYFWEDKEDLERYCDWQKLQPLLKEKCPEVVAAWEQYKTSRRMLSAVLRGVEP